jgi:hypothetical protein
VYSVHQSNFVHLQLFIIIELFAKMSNKLIRIIITRNVIGKALFQQTVQNLQSQPVCLVNFVQIYCIFFLHRFIHYLLGYYKQNELDVFRQFLFVRLSGLEPLRR